LGRSRKRGRLGLDKTILFFKKESNGGKMSNKIEVGTKIEIICEGGILSKGSKHKIYFIGDAKRDSGAAMVSGAKGEYLVRYKNQNIIIKRNEFKVVENEK
jgi:hypothetical protein